MKLLIYGVVQGVGFRPTVYRVAQELGLNGYVRNNGANVEVLIDGDPEVFLARLRAALSPLARIERVEYAPETPQEKGFQIVASGSGEMTSEPPADTAICGECAAELLSSARRGGYPFTNCTHCGARFTVIAALPYDRANTTMHEFPMCEDCRREYTSQGDRRFHHQTICCPVCGPQYQLYDRHGRRIEGGFQGFAALLDDGMIGVLKAWGGAHLCCVIEHAQDFREWYGREAKPFAIMVRDLGAVRSLFAATEEEERALLSPSRPIVLVRKKAELEHIEALSPGLSSVGVMLPYSGAHHILFAHLKHDALIMTSANPPGAPIYTDERVFELGADAYLLHNRRIANRCDDSVLKMHGQRRFFIRRSRGYVPSSFSVPWEGAVLALGAEENVTASLAHGGKVISSQYIGDAQNYDTREYLVSAAQHLLNLKGMDAVDAVAIDRHPGYATRAVGESLAQTYGAELAEAQHHHAHCLSLALDAGEFGEMVVLALDGAGYGDDGTIWGGEVLLSSPTGYERLGHLHPLPLPGGDAAVLHPERLLFVVQEICGFHSSIFEGREAEVLRSLAKTAPLTSSAGRVLDLLSLHLGACARRTYDGEPAMRLEPLLERGEPGYELNAPIKGRVVQTLEIFRQLFELRLTTPKERADAAHSFVRAMTLALTQIALDAAMSRGISKIGITGGVSYALPIVRIFEERVRSAGLETLLHSELPNGDGGISAGQCVYALAKRLNEV
ncbi:MAG: carbamoyltransferase HypF [Candidatus Thermoplasmatota archaeon]